MIRLLGSSRLRLLPDVRFGPQFCYALVSGRQYPSYASSGQEHPPTNMRQSVFFMRLCPADHHSMFSPFLWFIVQVYLHSQSQRLCWNILLLARATFFVWSVSSYQCQGLLLFTTYISECQSSSASVPLNVGCAHLLFIIITLRPRSESQFHLSAWTKCSLPYKPFQRAHE